MKHEKMAKKILAVILSASLTMGPAEMAGAVDISDEISADEEEFSEAPGFLPIFLLVKFKKITL